jgi:hypothetical protein
MTGQQNNCIAIGYQAGLNGQQGQTLAIGSGAGESNQSGFGAVAIVLIRIG